MKEKEEGEEEKGEGGGGRMNNSDQTLGAVLVAIVGMLDPFDTLTSRLNGCLNGKAAAA